MTKKNKVVLEEEKLVCVLKEKDLGIKILIGVARKTDEALKYFCCHESYYDLTSKVK